MRGSRRGAAVVLAAGEGKRLRSDTPKVLHQVAGRSLLGHVLEAVGALDLDQTVVVVSKRRDRFEAALAADHPDATLVVQDPPAGTGDAVRVALEAIDDAEVALVVAGDSPLITSASLQRLLDATSTGAACALATARVADPRGGGRVVRDAAGSVDRIVEERDATEEELQIDEINASIYAFDVVKLRAVLGKIDRENSQGEYYLTDVIGLLRDNMETVAIVELPEREVLGVNSRTHLAEVTAAFREQIARRWMEAGVSIVDPASTFIDATVEIEPDATIMPFTYLEGSTRVAAGAEVGPQTRVIDSEVGPGARVSFSVVRGSQIAADAEVGPFASLRPGTKLGRGSRLGTFVETKNTTLGEDSKANHLAYLGDARIGSRVNVGAGTITCNWDGRCKHETVIEDDAYIASDTMLVAPVRIGRRGATGAGAVVRDDVPDDALAVGVPARIIEGKGDRMERAEKPEQDGGG